MIAGIDVSTKAVDVVLLEDEGPEAEWFRFPLDSLNCWAAMDSLRFSVPNSLWWTARGVDLVGIEDPFSQSRATAKCYGFLIGGVIARLPVVQVMGLTDQKWKWHAMGRNKATKQEILVWVGERWLNSPDEVTQDALDAYAIAWAARELNRKSMEATG